MKCVVCKSNDINLKKVDEEIKIEKDIILISVEVLVCNNCGERYYDRKTYEDFRRNQEKLKK